MEGIRGGLIDPGERAVRFINNLTLSDDFRGKPFRLRPWQAAIPRKIFGTIDQATGHRQYRRVFIFLPRKQAKTQLSAAMAVFCLLGSGKQGQTILLAASDREQASHLFDKAREMIEADPYLDRKVRVLESVKRIETKSGGNVLKVIAADGRRQLGRNPSVVIMDELLTQRNRKLLTSLETSFGTRLEPLLILISTAGNTRGSLVHDEYTYAAKVRDGKVEDPTYLPIIYEAGPEDDWTDEATWYKAMPALGDFVPVEHFRKLLTKAKETPSEESDFKQFYLNMWVAAYTKWLNRTSWDVCGLQAVDPAALKGRECFGGLDLSNTSDMTAFVLVFAMPDGTFRLVCRFWIPEAYARERDAKGSTKYLEWARQGLITLTKGRAIDHDLIKAEVLALSKLYKIRKIRADPWNAQQIALQLIALGLDVEMMRQGTASMNEPLKFLEVLIAQGRLHHGDNAVLTWQADNAVAVKDSYGNIRLDKETSADKIDGCVCLCMGMAGAMMTAPKPKPRVSWT